MTIRRFCTCARVLLSAFTYRIFLEIGRLSVLVTTRRQSGRSIRGSRDQENKGLKKKLKSLESVIDAKPALSGPIQPKSEVKFAVFEGDHERQLLRRGDFLQSEERAA